MTSGQIPLRRLVTCLDAQRIPLNAEQRSWMRGPIPYWGAGAVVDYVDRHLFDEDLILLGEDGAPFFDPSREVAFYVNGPIWANNHVHVLRANTRVDPRFVARALNAVDYSRHIAGSTRDKLTQDQMLAIDVPNLPLDEQVRVADFLDDRVARIDAVVTGRAVQIRRLTEERDARVWSAIVGVDSHEPKRSTNLSWAPKIPESWGEPRICQVARMGTGHTPSRSSEEYWINCDVPWLTTGDVHRFRHDEIEAIDDTVLHISQLGLVNSAAVMHPAGTVALSRTASAGFSIIMSRAMATSQDYATWTPGPRLDSRYLLWCLRTMRHDIMGRLAIGSTHKTIYFPDLMSIRIPLPSLDEQRLAVAEIREIVSAHDALKAVLRRSIDLLSELKRSLITAAVSGEFDVSTARPRLPT